MCPASRPAFGRQSQRQPSCLDPAAHGQARQEIRIEAIFRGLSAGFVSQDAFSRNNVSDPQDHRTPTGLTGNSSCLDGTGMTGLQRQNGHKRGWFDRRKAKTPRRSVRPCQDDIGQTSAATFADEVHLPAVPGRQDCLRKGTAAADRRRTVGLRFAPQRLQRTPEMPGNHGVLTARNLRRQ